MTFKLCADRWKLFALGVSGSVADWSGTTGNRTPSRRAMQNCLQRSAEMATAINIMYDNQSCCRRALMDPTLPSLRQRIVLEVQEKGVDYQTDRSRKAWRQGWAHPRESAKWPTV